MLHDKVKDILLPLVWKHMFMEHILTIFNTTVSSPFSSCHSIHTMEHEFYECPEYLSNTPAEVERIEEYEYEVQFYIFLLYECTL